MSPQLLERLKAIEHGHTDVHYGDVGPDAPGQVQRLTTIARKGHDVKGDTEKTADRFQQCWVVVGYEDARSGWRRDVQSVGEP